jgi:hypothetical protein
MFAEAPDVSIRPRLPAALAAAAPPIWTIAFGATLALICNVEHDSATLVLMSNAEDAEDFAEDAEKSAIRLRRDIYYGKTIWL